MYKSIRYIICVPLLTLLLGWVAPADSRADALTSDDVSLLLSKSFDDKEQAIKTIAASGDPKAEKILKAILSGDLFYRKADKVLVYAEKQDSNYAVRDIFTEEDLGLEKKRKVKKVTINNQLRGTLKAAIAQLNLSAADASLRLAAATAILDDLSPEILPAIEQQLAVEQDTKVKETLQTAIALVGLKQSEVQDRLGAVQTISGNLNPAVKNELLRLLGSEKDPAVIKEAKFALGRIEARIKWFSKLETIFFGLSLGSVLVLAAIGLAITFGVIGVINMAHGELIMIGAYTTYVIQQLLPNSIGLALALSVPAAFCVSGLVGIVIEKSVIRFLYGRPLETLLATFGISLVLQQTVRSIFSPLNRSVATPDWMSGSITINPILSLTTNRVTIFVFAMIVFAGLYLLLKKSSLGLHVRAVAQNRSMARAMGVRAARVDALTFGLGSGIAGIAGVALSQLTNVGPNLGQAYIIDSFMVVVFGGVGNLWGTLLGGLSLGIANKFLEPWSGAVLAKILILIFIILFIQKRPQGLFPQKGRAAE